MDKPYNGSTEILEKIDSLLEKKTISNSAATRVLLEATQYAIKERYIMRLEIKQLQDHWSNKITPKSAVIVFFILYSFSISDIRQPITSWFGEILQTVFKLL